ncbi:MAG: helix-turn-helix transcriptional regulator [Gammaproteobacteria bacterium]|nr:helix-turn-helix transcriptional regulator [Gammaproteobacteria bacterium]
METRIAVDLKVFRRRSGLSQADVAHLLGVHRTQVSKFERGVREPSIEHVTILCLIYGLRLPDFCVAARPQFETVLAERLQTLPEDERNTTETARVQTIQTLTEQLADLPAAYGV